MYYKKSILLAEMNKFTNADIVNIHSKQQNWNMFVFLNYVNDLENLQQNKLVSKT